MPLAAPTILDKLVQLPPDLNSKELGLHNPERNLQKRAHSKYITQNIARLLFPLRSPLHNYYQNAFYCAGTIVVEDGKARTTYCNTRICYACNRIRTAKAIKDYMPQFEGYYNKSITLTDQNCTASNLKHEVRKYKTDLKLIRRILQRLGLDVDGIVKLEITYNLTTGLYHPHLHIIVRCENEREGTFLAESIINLWLEKRQSAHRSAQHFTKADEGSFIELFKYTTKFGVKEDENMLVHPESLDIIMRAQHKTRSFQPFGKIRKASEDVNEIVEPQPIKAEEGIYCWSIDDWFNRDTGEALTYHVLNPKFKVVRQLRTRGST